MLFTNFLMASGAEKQAVLEACLAIENIDKLDHIKRLSVFKIEKGSLNMRFASPSTSRVTIEFANKSWEYDYNDVYRTLHKITQRIKDPAMLCQFRTYKEIELEDLLSLPKIEIVNRWHMKLPFDRDEETMLRPCLAAGYIHISDGEIMASERLEQGKTGVSMPVSMTSFIYDHCIDTHGICPKCGEGASSSQLHFRNRCPDCDESGMVENIRKQARKQIYRRI